MAGALVPTTVSTGPSGVGTGPNTAIDQDAQRRSRIGAWIGGQTRRAEDRIVDLFSAPSQVQSNIVDVDTIRGEYTDKFLAHINNAVTRRNDRTRKPKDRTSEPKAVSAATLRRVVCTGQFIQAVTCVAVKTPLEEYDDAYAAQMKRHRETLAQKLRTGASDPTQVLEKLDKMELEILLVTMLGSREKFRGEEKKLTSSVEGKGAVAHWDRVERTGNWPSDLPTPPEAFFGFVDTFATLECEGDQVKKAQAIGHLLKDLTARVSTTGPSDRTERKLLDPVRINQYMFDLSSGPISNVAEEFRGLVVGLLETPTTELHPDSEYAADGITGVGYRQQYNDEVARQGLAVTLGTQKLIEDANSDLQTRLTDARTTLISERDGIRVAHAAADASTDKKTTFGGKEMTVDELQAMLDGAVAGIAKFDADHASEINVLRSRKDLVTLKDNVEDVLKDPSLLPSASTSGSAVYDSTNLSRLHNEATAVLEQFDADHAPELALTQKTINDRDVLVHARDEIEAACATARSDPNNQAVLGGKTIDLNTLERMLQQAEERVNQFNATNSYILNSGPGVLDARRTLLQAQNDIAAALGVAEAHPTKQTQIDNSTLEIVVYGVRLNQTNARLARFDQENYSGLLAANPGLQRARQDFETYRVCNNPEAVATEIAANLRALLENAHDGKLAPEDLGAKMDIRLKNPVLDELLTRLDGLLDLMDYSRQYFDPRRVAMETLMFGGDPSRANEVAQLAGAGDQATAGVLINFLQRPTDPQATPKSTVTFEWIQQLYIRALDRVNEDIQMAELYTPPQGSYEPEVDLKLRLDSVYRAMRSQLYEAGDREKPAPGTIRHHLVRLREGNALPLRPAVRLAVARLKASEPQNPVGLSAYGRIVARMAYEERSPKSAEQKPPEKSKFRKMLEKLSSYLFTRNGWFGTKEGEEGWVYRIYRRLLKSNIDDLRPGNAFQKKTVEGLGRMPRKSRMPRAYFGARGLALKTWFVGGFLTGLVLSAEMPETPQWYNRISWRARLMQLVHGGPVYLDETNHAGWTSWFGRGDGLWAVVKPWTWAMIDKSQREVIYAIDDTFDDPTKLQQRSDMYYRDTFGVTRPENIRWLRENPEGADALRVMQERTTGRMNVEVRRIEPLVSNQTQTTPADRIPPRCKADGLDMSTEEEVHEGYRSLIQDRYRRDSELEHTKIDRDAPEEHYLPGFGKIRCTIEVRHVTVSDGLYWNSTSGDDYVAWLRARQANKQPIDYRSLTSLETVSLMARGVDVDLGETTHRGKQVHHVRFLVTRDEREAITDYHITDPTDLAFIAMQGTNATSLFYNICSADPVSPRRLKVESRHDFLVAWRMEIVRATSTLPTGIPPTSTPTSVSTSTPTSSVYDSLATTTQRLDADLLRTTFQRVLDAAAYGPSTEADVPHPLWAKGGNRTHPRYIDLGSVPTGWFEDRQHAFDVREVENLLRPLGVVNRETYDLLASRGCTVTHASGTPCPRYEDARQHQNIIDLLLRLRDSGYEIVPPPEPSPEAETEAGQATPAAQPEGTIVRGAITGPGDIFARYLYGYVSTGGDLAAFDPRQGGSMVPYAVNQGWIRRVSETPALPQTEPEAGTTTVVPTPAPSAQATPEHVGAFYTANPEYAQVVTDFLGGLYEQALHRRDSRVISAVLAQRFNGDRAAMNQAIQLRLHDFAEGRRGTDRLTSARGGIVVDDAGHVTVSDVPTAQRNVANEIIRYIREELAPALSRAPPAGAH